MKQGSTGLTLREIQAYHQPSIELSPRKVGQWVKELPIANLGDSSRNIYHILVELNQSIVEPDKRLAILQKILPVAEELTQSLEKQFLNRHISLNDKQKKIAALVQAIQTEISLCCHAVIEALVEHEIKWSNKKTLAAAISTAMKFHGTVMLRCYQLYASVPSRIWRENYSLWQIAKTYEMTQTKIDNSDAQTLEVFFCKMLMLSVSNPYQLQQNEISALWEILSEAAAHASLSSHAYNKHHYVIALDSNTPPIHKSLFNDSVTKHLKLTLTAVVEFLKQKLVATQDKNQVGARQTMLIKHLIQTWSHGTHRAFARTPANEDLSISIGLGATHYILMQEPGADKDDRSGAEDTLEAMEGSLKNATLLDVATRDDKPMKKDYNYLSSGAMSDDVWAKLYRPDQAGQQHPDNNQSANNRSRDSIVKESYQVQSVDLINMSPGGYCIQLASTNLPKHAQTGEILGFLEGNHWSIGVVRWVRRQAKGGLVQMGIQLLAPGALPINVQLRNSRSEKNEFQRALLLPALTGIGQPTSLITNPISYHSNSKVRVVDHGNEYDVKLGKEITATSSFRQFQFERLGGEEKPVKTTKRSNDPLSNNDDMDGVWDLI